MNACALCCKSHRFRFHSDRAVFFVIESNLDAYISNLEKLNQRLCNSHDVQGLLIHIAIMTLNTGISVLRTVKEAYIYAWITRITVLQHANTKAVSIGRG